METTSKRAAGGAAAVMFASVSVVFLRERCVSQVNASSWTAWFQQQMSSTHLCYRVL